ncbi:hypothetical protein [Psychroflexus salis]|uniref:Uncharacterized protein n=1 Tax=Psychroflexus salis TaxID=1526574 RepID=A0A916ZNM9_9FLAO|nr:hypothetical protein [Psychroflexus salis]GGE06555.1 hypothetical protein GCM10010831_05060 [Psychroflexus salis]
MKTKMGNETAELKKTIKLVDGEFSKVQALDIVSSLIDQKINFHKVEGMQLWERDQLSDKKPINKRIDQLKGEKESFKNYIKESKDNSKKFKISGFLNIEVI